MALTETERTRIRRYLGWSDRYIATDNNLQQALVSVDSRAETVTEIRTLLARCDQLEIDIIAAQRRLKAYKVGSLELPGGDEIDKLRDMGRQWTGQLGRLLGVAARGDAWGGSLSTSNATSDGLAGGGNELSFG
jgi:hypothetical protein